jgi:transposase-like protein
MNKRKTYAGEFKAAMVREYIKDRKKLMVLAKTHAVHPNLIKNWTSYLLKHASTIFTDKRRKS